MENPATLYRIQFATSDEIYLHLIQCNDNFSPPLNEKVNIPAYSQKIFNKAVTFEAWNNKVLIGLIAAYFNDVRKDIGFITNVSILKRFMGLGISSTLMTKTIDYGKQQSFNKIKLEVRKDNLVAINLYKKFGFIDIEQKEEMIIMVLNINKQI